MLLQLQIGPRRTALGHNRPCLVSSCHEMSESTTRLILTLTQLVLFGEKLSSM